MLHKTQFKLRKLEVIEGLLGGEKKTVMIYFFILFTLLRKELLASWTWTDEH